MPKMSEKMFEILEEKMANIEESLSLSTPRRRKLNMPLSFNHDVDVNQNLEKNISSKSSLMEHKFSNKSLSPVIMTSEDHINKKLNLLKNDAERKRNTIKNLKVALQKVNTNDVSANTVTSEIDLKIRQAELEYALGREELQLLSIVEEARTIQSELEKEKYKSNVLSIYSLISIEKQSLILCAFQMACGNFIAVLNHENNAFIVDWVKNGDDIELQRGDRIIEVNGHILNGREKDEMKKICANLIKCDLVVIRKNNQYSAQKYQADNLKLQHRIFYLEEQVKELLDFKKEKSYNSISKGNPRSETHITSINISSSDDLDRQPIIYQRGPFVTKISDEKSHLPHTTLKNINMIEAESIRPLSSVTSKSMKNLSSSMSRISVSTDTNLQKFRKEREKEKERFYLNNRNNNCLRGISKSTYNGTICFGDRSQVISAKRNTKSLNIDYDTDNYASEPVASKRITAFRPEPPKKPLRLSLQRTKSLQEVGDNILTPYCSDKKRAAKRMHKAEQHKQESIRKYSNKV